MRCVDVYNKEYLLHIFPNAVKVDYDLLIVTITLACKIVSSVLNAVLLRLKSTEEDSLEIITIAVHEDGRHIQVALAFIHVPSEANCDLPKTLRQVKHTSLLHCECDLLLGRCMR